MKTSPYRYDNGAMGVWQTVENERRKGLGWLIFNAVASKLAADYDSDIYFWSRQGNVFVENSMKKRKVEVFDVQRWIEVQTSCAHTTTSRLNS